MATWPRDRFVGLKAGDRPGTVTVRGRKAGPVLHVNADASQGEIAVHVEGKQITTLTGDALDHAVQVPANLVGTEPSIVLAPRQAEVFSLRWDDKAPSRSL
jgi:hypothetical protein